MNAAEAMIALGGDIKPYQQALKQAEGETKATGSRLASLLSPGNLLKGVGVAASAGLGLATKQMLELQNATAKLRAETGMTAAEAEKAGAAINRMAGSNLQSVSQIGDAYSKVVTDLGLTGEAADKATEQFLRFSTATGQDAAGAVAAFDDILDAWGLTANDAQGVMDQLVVSHQKYGGSIEDNEAALATLAPSLRAMNMELDDGVEFLNLAASSGIDAASAAAGLNKAVKTLKPGQDLDDLVAQLGAIEDPTLRAQRGIELFGKSGAKLANAIKPGTTSLDEYAVSAGESVGATEAAADAMESTFGAQAQLLIKKFGSTVAEVMGPAGPILTGFASLATLAGTFGLDKLLSKAASSGPVTAAARAAGAAVGALFNAAMFVGGKMADAVAAALSLIPGSSVVTGAARTAGLAVGGLFVTGIGLGLAGLPAVLLEAIKNPINDFLTNLVGIKDNWDRFFQGTGWSEAPEKALDKGLTDALSSLNQRALSGGKEVGAAVVTGVTDEVSGIAVPLASTVGKALAGGSSLRGQVQDDLMAWMFPDPEWNEAKATAKKGGEKIGPAFAAGINNTTSRTDVENAWDALVEAIKNRQTATEEAAGLIGSLTGKKLAERLHDADPDVRRAAENYRDTVISRLENMNLRAGIVTKEAATAIAEGLQSKDKKIAAWSVNAFTVVHNAFPTPEQTRGWGNAAMEAYAVALGNHEDRLANAAAKSLSGAKRVMVATSPPKEGPLKDIDKWGAATGLAWVDAFIEMLDSGIEKADRTLGEYKKRFDKFVKDYKGIGSLFPSAGPEESRERLTGYIANLNKQLAMTTDPAERLAILKQIADYTNRLNSLIGEVSTEREKDIATLQGYLANIDKALLTEKDPDERAKLTAKWVTYYTRLEALRTPDEPNVVDTVENGRRLKEIEIDLKRIELERERSALTMTDESEEQNKERIKAIDHELDLLDAQQDAIDREREIRDLLIEQNKIRKEMGLAPLPIPGEPAPAAPAGPSGVVTPPSGLLPGGPAGISPSGMTPEREAELRKAIATNDGYIKELEAVQHRNAAQQKSLNEAYQRREVQLRELGVIDPSQPVGVSYGPGYTGARAHGGPVAAGRPYLVGEKGPEVFVPEIAGRILSSPVARRMMASGAWAAAQEAVRCLEIVVNNYNPVPETGKDSTERSLRTMAAVGVI